MGWVCRARPWRLDAAAGFAGICCCDLENGPLMRLLFGIAVECNVRDRIVWLQPLLPGLRYPDW
ncbi:MAG: hypothetical protein ACKPHU_04460, partial [Planctomycetaceae bacterium]